MDVTVRLTDVYRKAGGKWLIAHQAKMTRPFRLF